jgi:poly(3-hydroxybutyrate) depolymerase
MKRIGMVLAGCLGVAAHLPAQDAVFLRDAYCDGGRIFVDGFDARPPSDASGGSGGAYPGNQVRSVFVPQTQSQRTYYLHVPASYQPGRAHPVVIVLHGATGSAATTPAEAQAIRALFAPSTGPGGAIVIALPASGAQGGWVPSSDGPFIGAALDDVEGTYNVERARRYLWGFSAGAHFGYAMGLWNTDVFAAMAVKAGALEAFAGPEAPSQAERRLPVDIRVGQQDPLLPYAQADRQRFIAAGWTFGLDLTYVESGGGHEIDAADAAAAWSAMCLWAREP